MNNEMAKMLIPVVRKVVPNMIAKDIVDVQPMSGDIDFEELGRELEAVFSFRYLDKTPRHRFGSIIHSFIYGWLISDGRELITIEEFCERFPDINYEELASMTGKRASYANYKNMDQS